MKKSLPKWQLAACMVLYVTFVDGNVRTFYSRDIDRKPDNTHYWFTHLQALAENKWRGRVREYAIYRCINGEKSGDPIVKGTPQNILNT